MPDSQQLSDMLTTINPATGEELERYPIMGDGDVEHTIQKCHEAFLGWRHESPEKRADIIRAIGERLRSKKTELARLMTNEMGKIVSQGEQEVDLCAAICNWTADNGPAELKTEERELPNGGRGRITYSPLGVIYGIQPWNFPAYQVIRYAIANLMAGNGVLLKHAESVTGSGLMLEKLFRDAGVPDNLFSVLRISHDQSDDVIAHELVRGVTLTGSASAGRIIAGKAGEKLKKTVLELGSNDAYIVLADADLDKAVAQCTLGRVYNNGETCVAAKRFIVVDEIFDAFRHEFVKAMKDVSYGDPLKGDAGIGPMAREDLRDDLHEQVLKSVEKGARIQCGGEVPDEDGWWYPATVIDNVQPGQPAYDEELFGPVASLIRAKDAEDAMRIANDSRFGLGGGIFSADTDKAIELAEKHFDTGMVYINGFGLAMPNMPFGGVKDSGHGREHGGFGMKEFVNVKAVNVMG